MNTESIEFGGKKEIKNPMAGAEEQEGNSKTILEMSFEDHRKIKSTLGESELDRRMMENPSRTLGELMTDTEVKEFLDKQIEHLKIMGEIARRVEASEAEQNLFLECRRDFEQMVEYLDKLGKLPADFEG